MVRISGLYRNATWLCGVPLRNERTNRNDAGWRAIYTRRSNQPNGGDNDTSSQSRRATDEPQERGKELACYRSSGCAKAAWGDHRRHGQAWRGHEGRLAGDSAQSQGGRRIGQGIARRAGRSVQEASHGSLDPGISISARRPEFSSASGTTPKGGHCIWPPPEPGTPATRRGWAT